MMHVLTYGRALVKTPRLYRLMDGENDGGRRKDGWTESKEEEGVMDGGAVESVRRSDGWKGTRIRRRCQV